MQSELLQFLGLMRRAGKLSVGEEGTGQAARAGKAKLILPDLPKRFSSAVVTLS